LTLPTSSGILYPVLSQKVGAVMETAAEVKKTESSVMKEALRKLMRGHRPLIYLHTPEEERTFALISEVFREVTGSENLVCRWSATEGLTGGDISGSYKEPLELLKLVSKHREKTLYFLSDFHLMLRHFPMLVRYLRDLYTKLLDTGTCLVICSAVKEIPAELASEMAYLEIDLPDLPALSHFITEEVRTLGAWSGKLDERDIGLLSRTLQGLTLNEARHALKAACASSPDRESLIQELQREKKMEARKQSMVEYIPEVTPIDHIGGLENLKDWLIKRKALMHLEGAYDSEIIPKGILLMGISGCGKSLSIKAIASLWELPLYRLDMIRIYSGAYGGSPEDTFVRACEIMERVSPAVLWIDEIEMGIQPGEISAGATASRIFGYFLTWMQEKRPGLFLAATANRIDLLPAELLRRGRFDQLFFIDLPSERERLHIFTIHLQKRGLDPAAFDLSLMVELTDGCNGAEIEQCVISAIVEARLAGREMNQKDLMTAKRLIVPLSKTMGEQVRKIRQWAFNRATPATVEKPSTP
jgi:SpoVK/Ycf46/Vps4 family AAA+-type ATPase